MQKRIALFVSLILLLGMAIGCSSRTKDKDQEIQKDIQTKAAAEPETKDSDVQVASNEGKVTLKGKVKTPAAQKKIEQIAKEEPGAVAVDDQTTVEPDTMATQPAPPPPPVEKPKPQPIVVPAGTALTVKLGQALGSKTSQTGQTFLATLAQPVTVRGMAAIPAASTISGTVVSAKAKGKIKGEGELVLTLSNITVNGRTYAIRTATLDSTVKGKGKRTAVATGGGAAGGALIGGIAGGGKGAGIGALVGAGAGLIGGTLTGNKQIEYPAESALTFQLSAPLTLPPPNE
ncbi:MAG TPA: BON domain-containing protein [Candidatus Sulfotelmatobacter sp.]